MSQLNIEAPLNDIQKFNGEHCKLFNDNGDYLAKGQLKMIISFSATMNEYKIHSPSENSNKLELTIKNLDREIEAGKYTIKSIVEDENSYIELELKGVEFKKVLDRLTQKIDFSVPQLNNVDKITYEEFHKNLQTLDWTKIKIPPGCKGKDKATQADAFESMCQEILLRWGVENFGAIGKGTDRGRDGTFLIKADGWIPISTNYSNSWILQCKYSKDYSNLSNNEIYEELINVIMHRPDYYLLMTNRKVTNDFNDWLEELNNIKYHIPFKIVFIGKEILEEILSLPTMVSIREKYF